MIDAEALQGHRQIVFRGRGTPIEPDPAAGRIAQRTVLDAEHDIVAVALLERCGDEKFVVSHTVEIAGIEKVDAGVEGGMDRRNTLGPIRRAVHSRHAHAAEPDLGHLRTRLSELAMSHGMGLSLSARNTSDAL
jgi:hypothetical protein